MKSERRGKFGERKGKALAFAVLFAVLSFIIVSIGCVSAESSFTQQNNNKSAFSASWTTEAVDAPKYFTDFYPRAIAIDGFNRPHIAYGGDHLYHAYFDGIEWRNETVDNSPGVGRYASIAIDKSNNKVHISYFDNIHEDLKYATNASGAWVTSTIDSGYVGKYTTIAIDSNNNVHISYSDDANEDLKYATDVSGAWVTSTIDSVGDVGEYTSIAMDSNNKVHISYYDSSNEDLKYATDASGAWVTSTISSGNVVGLYTSIAIDSNDKVHISCLRSHGVSDEYGDLNYATNAAGFWRTILIHSGYVGKYTSIAIDSNNKVHISYYDATNDDLKYATDVSGAWVNSIIDSVGNVGGDTSIAIDSNDKVHISYYDATNEDLKYATDVSGAWVNSTIDSVGDVGEYTSIAIDSNNKVHISYYDSTNKDLKYATDASGSWVTSTIDSVGDVGSYTSIAIDSNDKVHISYRDSNFTNEDLKYATNASGSWVTSTIDSVGDVGWDTSIATDSNNKVHISYYDSTNKDLKYATNSVSYPAPDISVSPVSFDFGSVNVGSTSAPRTFTISNAGDTDLVIGTISITGTDASEFSIQNDNCSGQTIAPSDTCTVDVVFSPTSAGSKSANLSIPSNDPDENPVNIALSGTGASIFDTGPGTYPSIMGTHKGEIKPSQNINVSKLYTYPCVGTGGHTESIKLYENDELIASGTWNGYQDDYHNITITPSVTLLAGHTYNYTIVTGSYPQIIHAKSKNVTGGTITCDKFIDTNGKTYTDWIPAIRLEN